MAESPTRDAASGELTRGDRDRLFSAAALTIGKPEAANFPRQTAQFEALVRGGLPAWWDEACKLGPAVRAVRSSILWHQYVDWYKNDLAAG
jgi:hypothetical protein